MSLIQSYDKHLISIMREGMPYASDMKWSIPKPEGMLEFPDNLFEYAYEKNREFLEDYNETIMDRASPELRLKFTLYQKKWFRQEKKTNELFESCGCSEKKQMEKVIRESMIGRTFDKWEFDPVSMLPANTRFSNMIINPYVFAASCTGMSDAEVGGTGSSGFASATAINAYNITTVDSECYDRMALNISVANGNCNLGTYTDSGGNPNTFITETDSFAAATGFGWNSMTETSWSGTSNWIAHMQNDGACELYFNTGGTARWRDDSYSFPTFEDPFDSDATGVANTANVKIGHS